MRPADRLAEAVAKTLSQYNRDMSEEYSDAMHLVISDLNNALAAYRSAPVDIEACAKVLYERIMFHSPLGWDNTAELFREQMREHVHAVLREAGVIERMEEKRDE